MSKQQSADTASTNSLYQSTISVADVDRENLPTQTVSSSEYDGTQVAAQRLVSDGGCDSYRGTLAGKIGELCFAKYLPNEYEVDTEVREHGDGGWDFKYNGATWDVKTVERHRNTPDLTVDAMTRTQADFYALVNRLGPTTARIVGYAPREVVKNQRVRLNEYDRAYYRVPRSELIPFPQRLR